jgi:hypothetical protein
MASLAPFPLISLTLCKTSLIVGFGARLFGLPDLFG